VLLAFLEIRYLAGRKAADQAWEDERPERLKDLGTTRSLEILPLVGSRRFMRCIVCALSQNSGEARS
jgi:hypothetical protein